MTRPLSTFNRLLTLLFFVTSLALPFSSLFFSTTIVYAAGSWWDTQWSYRLPITVNANGVTRTNKPVEAPLNFTQLLAAANGSGTFDPNSVRVLEVDSNGNLLDANVPFQFDRATDYNAATNANGTLVFMMTGTTSAGGQRYYHLYFDKIGKGFTLPTFANQVSVTDNVIDEGQSSYQITSQNATYYYQKQSAAFSSLVDLAGNDWISYNATSGAGGSFRGIPNMVYPEGKFHPGSSAATSTLLAQGPLKITIHSVTNDDKWETLWEIFPTYARMTLLKKDHSYWFLYEGTPGGALDDTNDIVVRSNGTETTASTTWNGDLTGAEWLYFGDKALGRSLFMANHADDNLVDSYFPLTDGNGKMTVFGFGRQNTSTFLTTTPARFTFGLLDTTQLAGATTGITGAYVDLALQVGQPETTDHAPPVISNITCIPGPTYVTIAWETDELTTGIVQSGVNTAYGNTQTDSVFKRIHALKLSGLDPNASLHYQIAANDSNSNVTTTVDNSCSALGGSSLQSDDFNQCTLNTARWTYVDPQGGAGASLLQATGTDLSLAVPAGISHDVWRSGISAPRIKQAANNNDFTVDVKFNSSLSQTYQLQGLLIEQDQDDLLRINVQFDTGQIHLLVVKFIAGEPTFVVDRLLPQGIAPLYLRVAREGITWQISYSYDGLQWTTDSGYRFEHILKVSAVSLFAGNAGDNPAHTALIDYFFNTATPISPEDPVGLQLAPIVISPVGAGTATSQPVNPTVGNPNCGSPVTLSATPAPGWSFGGWSSQSGAISGLSNPKSTTFGNGEVVTANFTQNHYSLATQLVGNGTITEDPAQATYLYGDHVTLHATADPGWQFVGWAGDLAGNALSETIQISGDSGITAIFSQIPYAIEQTVTGEGEVMVEPQKSEYHYGDMVTVTAVPVSGWYFDGWQGDLSGNTPTQTIQVTGTIHLIARFTQHQYAIVTTVSGQGQIIVDPDKTDYLYGDAVTITAAPKIGWQFAGWHGDITGTTNSVTLSISQRYAVTALFTPIPYTIKTQVTGHGQIQLTPSPSVYHYGDVVTLTALPAPGSHFEQWQGDVSGSESSKTITITGSVSATALFADVGYALITNTVGSGNILITPTQDSYLYHALVTLQAVAAPGWRFDGWSGSLSGLSNPNPLLIDETETVTATFHQLTYTVTVGLVGGQGASQGGQVKIEPEGPYVYGQQVTLTAIPDANYTFLGWDILPTASSVRSRLPDRVITITVTDNEDLIANFEAVQRIYLPFISSNHSAP